MERIVRRLCLLAGLAVAPAPYGPAHAATYRAAPQVDITDEVPGDVIAAGARVRIDGAVRGSAFAAGAHVEVHGRIRDAVRVAAGDLAIAAQIGGDLTAVGGNIRIAPETHVAGAAWLAGGHVEVAGWTAANLYVAAASIAVSGEILGDVELAAPSIIIGPDTVIRGRLVYRSGTPARIDPAARIEGGVIRQPGIAIAARHFVEGAVAALRIAWLAGLAVVGTMLAVLFPAFTADAARTIARAPMRSFLVGFAVLAATPVAAALALVSVLGIPLALGLLVGYGLSLVFGYLTSAFFLGDAMLRVVRRQTAATPWRLGALMLALVGLAFLQSLPWFGGLVLFAAIVFGLGAAYVQLWERYTRA
ncbi:MAG TPA: hypothetical protein VF342_07615 [Alphaproteobacteria bacterium]